LGIKPPLAPGACLAVVDRHGTFDNDHLVLVPVPPNPAKPGEQEVERIVCVSKVSDNTSVYDQMEQIRRAAIAHNPPMGVHAVLIYQSGWFIYWVEGPAEALRKLVKRVSRDDRHEAQRVVHRSHGPRYLPTTWSMMMSRSREPQAEFGLRVAALSQAMEQGRQFSPTSLVRQLSTPLRLFKARSLADPETFHRVGVCGVGNEAFELVAWLGEKHGQTLAHRRSAGEVDLDTQSDYVEFMQDGHPCRVIAISRHALLHGLLRVFLPDWHLLILLMSGQPKRDDALLDRVREACQGLPGCPHLLGIAPDPETHIRLAGRAQTENLTYLHGDPVSAHDWRAIWRQACVQLQRAGPPSRPVRAMSGQDLAA
jgi:Sensors of blue-light using FAD